jgi:hypothetical protein
MSAWVGIETKMEEQEGFTHVNSRSRQARKAREAVAIARAVSEARIPGALWSDVPLSRSHLPGIPFSYYDDEIVMIRQRTAELIERQRAELRAQARARTQRRQPVQAGGQWYRWENGEVQRVSSSEWQGVDE